MVKISDSAKLATKFEDLLDQIKILEGKLQWASRILHHLALERDGEWRFLGRWYMNDEPLRNDAINFLRSNNIQFDLPPNSKYPE